MLTVLLDENIAGFKEYLARLLYSPTWESISSELDVRFVVFHEVELAKGTSDQRVWEFCQEKGYFLLTDNRNSHKSDSLEAIIKAKNDSTNLPVFTISDMNRFRSDRSYGEQLIAKLLEYLLDEDQLGGTGRLYLP